jgi:hypothetical protein
MGLERRHGGRIARGLLAEIRRDSVARDKLRQHEHDKSDPDSEQHERGRAGSTKARKLEEGRSLRRDLGASARAVGAVVKG